MTAAHTGSIDQSPKPIYSKNERDSRHGWRCLEAVHSRTASSKPTTLLSRSRHCEAALQNCTNEPLSSTCANEAIVLTASSDCCDTDQQVSQLPRRISIDTSRYLYRYISSFYRYISLSLSIYLIISIDISLSLSKNLIISLSLSIYLVSRYLHRHTRTGETAERASTKWFSGSCINDKHRILTTAMLL